MSDEKTNTMSSAWYTPWCSYGIRLCDALRNESGFGHYCDELTVESYVRSSSLRGVLAPDVLAVASTWQEAMAKQKASLDGRTDEWPRYLNLFAYDTNRVNEVVNYVSRLPVKYDEQVVIATYSLVYGKLLKHIVAEYSGYRSRYDSVFPPLSQHIVITPWIFKGLGPLQATGVICMRTAYALLKSSQVKVADGVINLRDQIVKLSCAPRYVEFTMLATILANSETLWEQDTLVKVCQSAVDNRDYNILSRIFYTDGSKVDIKRLIATGRNIIVRPG